MDERVDGPETGGRPGARSRVLTSPGGRVTISIDTADRVVALSCDVCGVQIELPIAVQAIEDGVPSFLDVHTRGCTPPRPDAGRG